ncbi:MAG: hypothetical protein Q8899_01710 [Weeping tea tree witches'-broom phytoplasma]|uniref:hypothetical protein n=1 Tax=Candidatus Phytoplasma melaleucae TaxID=2982630 RepID=UPI002939AF4E|nr:hypothetical protein [Weeping tea tree witches'-broom phytoplasma]
MKDIKNLFNKFPLDVYWWVYLIFFCFFSEIVKILLKNLIKFLCNILLLNFNFIFKKKKDIDNIHNKEIPQISIQNQMPYGENTDNNLTLIELKMLEIHQRETRNSKDNLLRLELNQHKIETRLELNQQKSYFEKEILKQQISYLEKELNKIQSYNNNMFNGINNNGNYKANNNDDKKSVNNIKEATNLSLKDENLQKQIPESLQKIFDKIENFTEIQLFMLNNMPVNNNSPSQSYYDHQKKVLYVEPKDLLFVRTLLIEKQQKYKGLYLDKTDNNKEN